MKFSFTWMPGRKFCRQLSKEKIRKVWHLTLRQFRPKNTSGSCGFPAEPWSLKPTLIMAFPRLNSSISSDFQGFNLGSKQAAPNLVIRTFFPCFFDRSSLDHHGSILLFSLESHQLTLTPLQVIMLLMEPCNNLPHNKLVESSESSQLGLLAISFGRTFVKLRSNGQKLHWKSMMVIQSVNPLGTWKCIKPPVNNWVNCQA